jgi:LacI family transcriptional regulator
MAAMQSRRMPTQEEVAQKAGVNRSTVSRALRGDRRISEAERARIGEIALRMGYRPNPMITALMQQVRQTRPHAFQSVLAWVVLGWDRKDWEKIGYRVATYTGASQRAAALGYSLEPFFLEERPPTSSAFLDVLAARGIRGLLLDVPPSWKDYENWRWDGFTGVTVGFRLGAPALHFVGNDLFAATWSMLNKLEGMGYRRIGLAVDASPNQMTRFRIIGGFQAYQIERVPKGRQIEVWQSTGKQSFSEWLERNRPDIVVCDHDRPAWAWWQGGSIPGYCPVAAVETTRGSDVMGTVLDPADMGRAAVDLLTAHLIRNETGIPPIQKGSLLEPSWYSPE